MKYLLDKQNIQEKAGTTAVFQRGSSLYRLNAVGNVSGVGTQRIRTSVMGSQLYQVQLDFDKFGLLTQWSCTCPAHQTYKGCCKHTVAVLLKLSDINEKNAVLAEGEDMAVENKEAAEDIMAVFRSYRTRHQEAETETLIQQFAGLKRKQGYIQLNMEVYLNLDLPDQTAMDSTGLSLRIGDDRLYVVQKLGEFIEAYTKQRLCHFGKNFTYDPTLHMFNDSDKRILDFLSQIWFDDQINRQMNNMRLTGDGVFNRKHLRLTSYRFDLLADILMERTFRIGEISDHQLGRLVQEVPHLIFTMQSKGRDVSLIFENRDQFQPLVGDSRFVYDGEGTVYRIPNEERNAITMLYDCFKAGNHFLIPERMIPDYLTFMHPIIQHLYPVELPEEWADRLIKWPLRKEIYMDVDGANIVLFYKFRYGDYEAQDDDAVYEAVETGQILVRDSEGEQEVRNLFKDPKFLKGSKGYMIVHEHDQYQFIKEDMQGFKELATLYMTKRFHKRLRIKPVKLHYSIEDGTQMNWLDFQLQLEGVDSKELVKILEAYQLKMAYYRRENGEFLDLSQSDLGLVEELKEHYDLKLRDFEKAIPLPASSALTLKKALEDEDNYEVQSNPILLNLAEQLGALKDVEWEEPQTLKSVLRNYQKVGFRWLSSLSQMGMGGVLADDMGLGKTVQILSYILSEVEKGMTKPVLIVAPSSLVYNWMYEIQKFTPMLKAQVIAGSVEEREEYLGEALTQHVLITSYHLIRRDVEWYQKNAFHSIILDEAQHIKNDLSKGAKAVKAITANHRFALTGTPMENHLGELWSIFDFVLPGHLGSRTWFRNQFINPIMKDRDAEKGQMLAQMIRPFLLRRLKSDVLTELPEKIENQITIELSEAQKKLYAATVQSIRGEIMSGIRQNGIQKMRIQILAGLTRLRQICCHPSVYLEDYDGESGKFEAISELMAELKEAGHRPLIFSQFTSVLKLLREMFEEQGYKLHYLDGSTPVADRLTYVNAFNEGDGDGFLISLKAGGTGLNLTGADTVIHFDPWWNPAVEDQATDRAHRIGQVNTVHVMKLICKGTIEEKIRSLQQKKKELIDQVIQPGEALMNALSVEEIEELLNYEIH